MSKKIQHSDGGKRRAFVKKNYNPEHFRHIERSGKKHKKT